MAIHTSILAWEIPCAERSLVGYSPWGSQRVRHDRATHTFSSLPLNYLLSRCLINKKSNSVFVFQCIYSFIFYWSILIYHIVILYDISHMWNLKNNTNECIHKTVTDSQTNLWLPKEIGSEERQIKGMGLVDTNHLGFFFNCFYSFFFFFLAVFKLSLSFLKS